MQNFSYHTHTIFSDGRNTAEEMVQQAVKCGLSEIGFSEHLVVHKNFRQSPSWPKLEAYHGAHIYRTDFSEAIKAFEVYKAEINRLKSLYPLKIYIGAEVDFFTYDGWLEEFKNFQKQTNLDYYITGNHFLFSEDCEYPIDADELTKHIPNPSQQKEYLQRHFLTINKAAQSGIFDFIAHIDYMRRVSGCNDENFMPEKELLLQTLAKHNIPAELSTKGLRKNGRCYPAPILLQKMLVLNIPVIISDDAHRCDELCRNFSDAEKLLHNLGYKNRWKLNKF